MIHYIKCPLSGSVKIREVLKAKDHTVSGETFGIWENAELDYRFTNPVPEKFNMHRYYESDMYVSHSGTKKGVINRLYHLAQTYTMAYKKRAVIQTTGLSKGNLLDYGSGTGKFAAVMQKAGWGVDGFEPNEEAAQVAIKENKINLLKDVQNKESQYDAITLWHVLEHIYDPHECIMQLKKGLKNNGVFLIALPNFHSRDAQTYGAEWAGYDVPRHLHHFSYKSFSYVAEKCDLEVSSILPMHLDSFYVSMLSEKYNNEKGSQLRGVFTGLNSWLKGMRNNKEGSSILYVCRQKYANHAR